MTEVDLSFLVHRYQCPACHKTGVVVKQAEVEEVCCPACNTPAVPVSHYSHDLTSPEVEEA